MKKSTIDVGFHHGLFQVLPPTWTFPRMTCKKLIDNWYFGNKIEKIPLLDVFRAFHEAHLGTKVNRNAVKVNLR